MTYRQVYYQNLNTPISKKISNLYGQKMESLTSILVKEKFNQWLNETFHPTYFLTVQLPDNKKSTNLDNAKEHLRNIMKAFEKSLMNNWKRHHLLFIAFAELGISDNWHFHILFNHGKFSEQELQNAIFRTNIREKLPSYCLELKHIDDNTIQTQAYCIKEMKVYFNRKFDSDRIIFSNCLFGI